MKRTTRGLLANPWSGSLLALLALGSVLTTDSRAGCAARLVSHRSQSTQQFAHLEMLTKAGAISSPTDGTSRDLPAPCSGAFCSGNPAPPFSALPNAIPSGGEEQAIVPFQFAVTGSGTLAFPDLDETFSTVDRCSSIFHPPRFQAACTSF